MDWMYVCPFSYLSLCRRRLTNAAKKQQEMAYCTIKSIWLFFPKTLLSWRWVCAQYNTWGVFGIYFRSTFFLLWIHLKTLIVNTCAHLFLFFVRTKYLFAFFILFQIPLLEANTNNKHRKNVQPVFHCLITNYADFVIYFFPFRFFHSNEVSVALSVYAVRLFSTLLIMN